MNYKLGLSAEPISNTISELLTGVGMIRSEYLCRFSKEYITTEKCREYIRNYVSSICKLFYPNEVWYRTTEMLVPEINSLKGADAIFEEKHYLLGSRGIRRGLRFPDTFILELNNLKEIANSYDNLHVLFPYINDPKELELSLNILNKIKFPGKYGIMAEIPSAILILEKFASMGISNITIGVNDLTSLTLGVSRSSYLDHTHPAVLKLIEMANEVGKKFNIPVSVGGYVSKKLDIACQDIGVDSFIVHYKDLPQILAISKTDLEYLKFSNELEDKYV